MLSKGDLVYIQFTLETTPLCDDNHLPTSKLEGPQQQRQQKMDRGRWNTYKSVYHIVN